MLPPSLQSELKARVPLLWLNDAWRPREQAQQGWALGTNDIVDAEQRLNRLASLLRELFPELGSSDGIIESPLLPAERLRRAMTQESPLPGQWFIKGDHALPVAGSIKARGGIYEVLVHAEDLAQQHGLVGPDSDPLVLASPGSRALYGRHRIVVGSTGNLGLSIGLAAAALGFQVTVHVSAEAKVWKKARLRAQGVDVVEHAGDFGAAVAAGREYARNTPNTYFVDDENSKHLFLGYSTAAIRLKSQLAAQHVIVDDEHPLFVYLPCGVGGAPGGVSFGLRQLLGDNVHCFLAEPVEFPCVLLRLASREDRAISVGDLELGSDTAADGLAVGRASAFVVPFIRSSVSGVFTVPDDHLFEDLYRLEKTEGMRIEPSAAAGFRGPQWLLSTTTGRRYLEKHNLHPHLQRGTHILWTTGGALLPGDEYAKFHERGRSQVSACS
jgi:D-serine dehydratase